MYSFRNAKWSWPITVIPLWIFLWIHYGTFQIFQEQLSSEYIHRWRLYGVILISLWIFHTVFTIVLIFSRSTLEKTYAHITLWTYFLFVFLYLSNFYSMIPPSVPGWVASENKRLYALIFIAPTLLHSLAIINANELPLSSRNHFRSLQIIGITSIACALLLIVVPKAQPGILHRFLILLFLLSSIGLLNGLIKLFDINHVKKFLIKARYIVIAKPLLAISFILTGMFLNSDILFDAGAGNFSEGSFYAWSVLNGLAICAPDFKHKMYRITIFLIRSMTYSYIIWLIITYMPHLPLSAITISSFGLGYLMITPLVIIIFHTKLLVSDSSYLYHHLSRQTIQSLFVSAISVPILINTFQTFYNA